LQIVQPTITYFAPFTLRVVQAVI